MKAAKVDRMLIGYIIVKESAIELIDCAQFQPTDITDQDKQRLRAVSDAQLERDLRTSPARLGVMNHAILWKRPQI